MKIHSIQYDTSLKQGYHSGNENPVGIEKKYNAGLREKNNRGYSVAFSGSGASKQTSEAAVKVLEQLKPFVKNISKDKFKFKPEIGEDLFLADDYVIEILKKRKPKNYKYGEYGKYPKYKENLNKTLWGKLLISDKTQKVGEYFDAKPSVGQALAALFIAGGLRPITNIAMAGKDDKEDSMYAASHAIASAVIGYAVTSLIMSPFDEAFKQITKKAERHLKGKEKLLNISKIGPRRVETSPIWKNISQVCKMSLDTFILGVPKALLTIALIPPILKYVFGMEKKSKNTKIQREYQYAGNFVDKNAFFKGGVK